MPEHRNRTPIVVANRQAFFLLLLVLLWAAVFTSPYADAQTYSVLYNFTGGQDGAAPRAGVTLDRGGNMYGTTSAGGNLDGNCSVHLVGCGGVFRLKHSGSAWVLSPLYGFQWTDGAEPYARVVFGPDGTLYGTTRGGGHPAMDCNSIGCGVVFNLRPPATVCKTALCPWTENLLWVFRYDLALGGNPLYGDLIFDPAGNILGTTWISNQQTYGGIFKLVPSGSSWTFSFVYQLPFSGDGGELPYAGVIADSAGNLYGTTSGGGPPRHGVVYELTPSGSQWTEQLLYSFQNGSDGGTPIGGLVFDRAGNLYGTTLTGGAGGGGTVYELSPSAGSWTLTTLHSFSGTFGSFAVLTMDASGNLYGTTVADGAFGQGNVFKLTHSNGGWTYTSLYDFTGGNDGGQPYGQVTLDASDNLYGTTWTGGAHGQGVVWEITP